MATLPRVIHYQTPKMRVAQPVDYFAEGVLHASPYAADQFAIQGPDGKWLSPCQNGEPFNDQWADQVLDQESFPQGASNVLTINRARFDGKSYSMVILG